MNLSIKSAYYEALNKNDMYPPWTIAFQPPPKLDVQPETNRDNTVIAKKSSQRDAYNLIQDEQP